jgi:predicted Rossmann fold nucleotide-binding protein DprA/Smf involved in DNA uptake
MTKYLNEKKEGCLNLAMANVKKVTTEMIRNEAESLEIPYQVMKQAWDNYMEFGNPELRYKGKNIVTLEKQAEQISTWQKEKRPYFPVKEFTTEKAGEMLKNYIFSGKNVCDVTNKYEISARQFYELIRELNVSGTVLGRKVLDPKQYAKIDIKEVIKFHKKPHLFNKTSVLEIGRFQRVLFVLKKYL